MARNVRPVAVQGLELVSAVRMETYVFVEEAVSFIQDQGEARRRASWEAVDVFRREREGNADLVALNQLVITVHVGVVRRSRGRVPELIHVVDLDTHLAIDILNDAERTVLDNIFDLVLVIIV